MTFDNGSAQAGTPTDSNTTPASDWVRELPNELRSVVEAKGYRTPSDVVQAYAHAERAIGADKVPLPRDGQWDAVARQKLGIPEAPDGYRISRPDMPAGVPYDEALEKAALPVAHKLGLTPQQVQGLVDFISEHRMGELGAFLQTSQASLADSERQLRHEFGTSFDTQVALASRAARRFGGEPLIQALNDSGFGNNPHLVRAFAKIGGMLAEDHLRGGRAPGLSLGRDEALREIARIQGDANGNGKHAYWDSAHPEHDQVIRRLEALNRIAHGED